MYLAFGVLQDVKWTAFECLLRFNCIVQQWCVLLPRWWMLKVAPESTTGRVGTGEYKSFH
jgi:hypothetical protein